jgi:hypothetical protein
MEYTQIINLITSLGLPTAIAILLWKRQTKMEDDNRRISEEHKKEIELKDIQNRKDTQELIDRQDTQIARQDKKIESMEISAKEDKKVFADTVESFQNAVKSFESINCNVINIQDKLSVMEQDITIIKTKMDK